MAGSSGSSGGSSTQLPSTNIGSGGLNNTTSTSTVPSYYPSTGTAVSSTPSPPFPAPILAPTSDFRVRVAPLNPAIFYGSTSSAAASPLTSGFGSTGSLFNTGITGVSSATALPATAFGASNLLQPLIATNGVLFPYSPQITFQQDVDYTQTEMIQTNLTYEVYRRTPSVNITIAGKFTIQNQTEGQYAMAAIHFFRVASKMYFGTLAGPNAGLPPPILLLNGYGTYMFNNLNCILKTHSWSYDDAIDTVSVQGLSGGTARLPCVFTLSINLTVQQTPQQMRSQFNLDAFRTGQLMTQGGWI